MENESRPVILCVDHRATNTEMELRRWVLERAGYRTLSASSTSRACEILHRHKVDLVLMEQRVPTGIRGRSLAELLKRINPDVPLAIYTADVTQVVQESRIANLFITKLVSRNEFLSTIQQLLSSSVNERRLAATSRSGHEQKLAAG